MLPLGVVDEKQIQLSHEEMALTEREKETERERERGWGGEGREGGG